MDPYRWMDKENVKKNTHTHTHTQNTHTTKCYSAIKNEILLFAGKW
jgi:hypothetical protein